MTRTTAALLASLVMAFGCSQSKTVVEPLPESPDYSRQLPAGSAALRLVTTPSRMPDLGKAWRERNVFLLDSIDQSIKWFGTPSSRQFFPFPTSPGREVTHAQALASLHAFKELIESAPSERVFVNDVIRFFDLYESVGYNGEGIVLFTGYYSPIFHASRIRTDRFKHPLYTRPDDLVTDQVTGEPKGRRLPSGQVVSYPTRREIEQSRMLAGNELVWLEDALSAYIIHVNGSARLRLTDGSTMHIGYAGKTDRPYKGLGAALLERGMLKPNQLSLASIRQLHRQQPAAVEDLILRNESYVFFTEYTGENWPAGSLGVRVTREHSLATDKRIYPRGGVVLVDTKAVTFSQGHRPFTRFMLDQDTGGAINAPGRADIFMGIGPEAEILAGGQYAEGRLHYLFLKPQYIERFLPSAHAIANVPDAP